MMNIQYQLMSLNHTTLKDHSAYAERIMNKVIEHLGISADLVLSDSRIKDTVECRQICMWAIRKKTNLTLKKIAKMFNRDHATVLFGIKTIERYIEIKDNTGLTAIQIYSQL